MKTPFKPLAVAALAAALAAAFGLTACQKETLTDPQTPTTHANDDRAKFVGNLYTLTKHGNASLSYDNAGRLKLVKYAPGAIDHVTYSYSIGIGPNWVRTFSYLSFNGKINQSSKYLLDESGRCYEEQRTIYTYSGGFSDSQTDVYTYQYNAQGYMKKRFDKNNPNQRYEYVFNAAGDLIKVTTHAPNSGVPSAETTYSYSEYVGAPLRTDRNRLNNLVNGLPDDYLAIFGKSSKHLVYGLKYKNLYSNSVEVDRSYKYFFNADNYVTQQNISTVGEQPVYLIEYKYLVTVLN